MNNYTFGDFTRINKTQARKLYAEGKTFYEYRSFEKEA